MNVINIEMMPKCCACGDTKIAEYLEYREYGDCVWLCQDCFKDICKYVSEEDLLVIEVNNE